MSAPITLSVVGCQTKENNVSIEQQVHNYLKEHTYDYNPVKSVIRASAVETPWGFIKSFKEKVQIELKLFDLNWETIIKPIEEKDLTWHSEAHEWGWYEYLNLTLYFKNLGELKNIYIEVKVLEN